MSIDQKIFEHCIYTLNCMADEPDGDPESRSRLMKICAQKMEEAALGHARYETARRMNPKQWADAWELNTTTGKPFDEIIDEMQPLMFPKD